jgi:SpoVK/Ycf46/Vps4 family AAA+-type ATPase
VLLLGVQGCGKSMLAKAIAGGFGVPLVRLDFGTLYDKYHGETEKNLRAALASAEQLAPCVLWIDEIEKGLSAGSGDGDGGVSRRVLGYLLTWMAERKSRGVPGRHRQPGAAPAGRTAAQGPLRRDLLRRPARCRDARGGVRLHLADALDPAGFDLPALAAASDGFSGAEIEQAIVGAVRRACGKEARWTPTC